jgi:hypothetical protein
MAIEGKRDAVLGQVGNPDDVAREIGSFRKAARALSSKHPRMIERYAKQWVAVYRGRVRAQGSTFKSVLEQVDQKNLPRQQVIVRFIDGDERTMIL